MISWVCYVLILYNWLLSVLAFKSADQMSYHTGCLFMHMSCFYGVLENDLQKPLRVSGDKSLPEYFFCYIVRWRHYPPSGSLPETKKMWNFANGFIDETKQTLYKCLVQEEEGRVFLSCPLIPPTMLQAYAKKHSRSLLSFSPILTTVYSHRPEKVYESQFHPSDDGSATAILKWSSITAVLSAKGVFNEIEEENEMTHSRSLGIRKVIATSVFKNIKCRGQK